MANAIYVICLIGILLFLVILCPSLHLLIFHFYNLFTFDKLLFIGAIGTFIIALYYRDEKLVMLCICGISSILFLTFLCIADGRLFHRHLSTYIPLFAIMAGYVGYILYRKIKCSIELNKSHYKRVAYVVLLIILVLHIVNMYNFGYTANGEGFNIYGSGIKEVVEQLNNEVDTNEKIIIYIPRHFPVAQFYDANKFTTKPISTRLIPIKAGRDYNPRERGLSPYNNSVSSYIEENNIKYILNRPSGFPYDGFPTIEEILSNSNITTIQVKAFSPINVINIADLRRAGVPTLLKVEHH